MEKTPTPQEFIEKWPLYTRAGIVNFEVPDAITLMCNECKKATTWQRGDSTGVASNVFEGIFSVWYKCGLCKEQKYLVIYRKLDWRRKPELPPGPAGYYNINDYQWNAVQKIGQLPAPSIHIPAELKARLGASEAFYREGLMCRGYNLGVGAVAYMRRVIEDKTDELIDVVVDLAKTQNIDEKEIKALAAAKTQVRYEDKLRVASEVIPNALRPGGVNPLGQLYRHLSVGVHDKTDDQCIEIFDDLKEDFEYVFRNLHLQAKEARAFADRVQKREGKPVS